MVDLIPKIFKCIVDANGCYRSDIQVLVAQDTTKAHAKQLFQRASTSLSTIGIVCLFSAYTTRCLKIQRLLNPIDFIVLVFLLSISCFWRRFHAKLGHTHPRVAKISYLAMSISMSVSLTSYCGKILDSMEGYSLTLYCVFVTIAAMAATIVAFMHGYDVVFVYSPVSCDEERWALENTSSIDRRLNLSLILLSVSAASWSHPIANGPLIALQTGDDPYDWEALEIAMWRMKYFVVIFAISAIIVEFLNILNGRYRAWFLASAVNSTCGIILVWQSTQCIMSLAELDPEIRLCNQPQIRAWILGASSVVWFIGGISIIGSITRFMPRPATDLRRALEFSDCIGDWRSVQRQVLTDDMIVSLLKITGLTEKERDSIVSALYHLPADSTEDQVFTNDIHKNEEQKGSVKEDKNCPMLEGHLDLRSGNIDIEMGLRVPPLQ